MGVIKTALEIALEKTENVKGDKSSINQFEARRQGKKLANAFLAEDVDIAGEIKKAAAGDRESLKQGIFDVFITQIALPSAGNSAEAGAENEGNDYEIRLAKLGKGFSFLFKTRKNEFSALFKQLTQVFSHYRQESTQYEQLIRQQYAPKLRKKEEEVSRRLGREVRIDPMQDPEFIAFYNQHMNALKSNYEGTLGQFKEEVKRMFEEEKT